MGLTLQRPVAASFCIVVSVLAMTTNLQTQELLTSELSASEHADSEMIAMLKEQNAALKEQNGALKERNAQLAEKCAPEQPEAAENLLQVDVGQGRRGGLGLNGCFSANDGCGAGFTYASGNRAGNSEVLTKVDFGEVAYLEGQKMPEEENKKKKR